MIALQDLAESADLDGLHGEIMMRSET